MTYQPQNKEECSKPVGASDRSGNGAEWTALDTHYAAEAAGIRSLPAPLTWTALHKFAEEVARAAVAKATGAAS